MAALHDDLSILDSDDQLRAKRALAILNGLLPLVDRIPVARLLKKLVDATDYRAILAIGHQSGTGGRLWRNLDKLIEDARDSDIVNVRDFLDYLTIINDAGSREGEAPAEVQGAVRLMTIHKAKGLQFPIVVLADASREPKRSGEAAYLFQKLGLVFKLDPPSMLYRLAKWQDQKQDEAEEQRVLYVALTRAQQKLIINGHATLTKKDGWAAKSWLKGLSAAAQVDINTLVDQAGTECITHTMSGEPVRAWVLPPESSGSQKGELEKMEFGRESDAVPIFAPLTEPAAMLVSEDEQEEFHTWSTTDLITEIPPVVIGRMVHKAIELWMFPDNPQLSQLLEAAAFDAGLAQPAQRAAAVSQATKLLSRLSDSPLRLEIEDASQRFHELPYSRMVKEHAETGYIDLLYCSADGWQIVDFKTDAIRSNEQRNDLVVKYTKQMQRYAGVVKELLDEPVQTRICFLDDQGKVSLVFV